MVGNCNTCTYKCIFGLTMLILVARTTRRYCTPQKKVHSTKLKKPLELGNQEASFPFQKRRRPTKKAQPAFFFPFRFHYKHLCGVTGPEVGMKALWRRATEFHVGTTMLRNHPKNTCTFGGLWRSKVGGKELQDSIDLDGDHGGGLSRMWRCVQWACIWFLWVLC